ncbi:hypothetical protein [Streptomyces clavuligerus]|uniref:Uncharacterized protein n=1 Tax=Streptomyces clavuligerus TaxID=1901 RepID=B5GS37_STRCL|nr:hypothetical protein [Streptomyces clavuligerus]EDY49133.1 hypothetical protein SSCG_02161 [Streptomyces clavuligerus]EFG03827.1 Hypothetical protein SCLAV_p0336 [Streptomyces clavuligerus]MBY6307652.1 hypothetical protein [Streptomyces clavuligerus]QCS09798.1 hypothetical protein CRV15_29750 [Streptomyces clavuligerus]QPJ98158.1 hypothetical protein GE265_34660 [Streptomyces clavuligerus]
MLQRLVPAALTTAAAGLSLVLGAAGTADATPAHERIGVGAFRVAIVYEHANFEGAALSLYASDCVFSRSWRNLPHEWNDRISSISIEHGCSMVAYEHWDISGALTRYRLLAPNLGTEWNDRISSLAFMP